MVLEPNGYNVLGITIDERQTERVIESFVSAYEDIGKKDAKWRDTEFCKREIASLWGAAIEMIEEFSDPKYKGGNPTTKEMGRFFNSDNQVFMEILGHVLQKNEALSAVLKQMQEIDVSSGSIHFSFPDRLRRGISRVTVDSKKLLNKIKEESESVRNSLGQFVDYVKDHKTVIITGAMLAGAIVISVIALPWVGVAVGTFITAKQLILAGITILCAIQSVITSKNSFELIKEALSRFGLEF